MDCVSYRFSLTRGNKADRATRVMPRYYSHLGSQRGHGSLEQVLGVIFRELDLVGRSVELSNGNGTRSLESVGDTDGVNASVEERFRGREEGTSEDWKRQSTRERGWKGIGGCTVE
jgi:hypothetical protein